MAFRFDISSVSPDKGSGGQEINNQDKTITENGQYTADEGYTGLGTVDVNVPNPSTGTLSIEQNGTFDVTDYAEAQVNVPSNELAKIDVYTDWNSYYSGGVGAVLTSMSYKEGKYYLLDANKNSKGYACRICDNSTRVEDGYHVRKCEVLWRRDKSSVARVDGAIRVTPENATYEIITEGLIWDFSESKGFKMAAGWPVSAKVTAPRCYDTWNTITLGPNVSQYGWGISASTYPGLSYTYSEGYINILPKQQLPNREENSEGRYCIGSSTNSYSISYITNYLEQFGSLTVDSGKYSSFYYSATESSKRFLYITRPCPQDMTKIKMIIKFKTPTSTSSSAMCPIFSTDPFPNFWGVLYNAYKKSIQVYDVTPSTGTMTTNTEYWLQVSNDPSAANPKLMKTCYIKDNGYTLDTLPDISEWTEFTPWQYFDIFPGYSIIFGMSNQGKLPSSSSTSYRLTIDMANTIIDIDDQPFFRYEGLEVTEILPGMLAEGLTDDGEARTYNLYHLNGNYCLDTAEEKEGWTWVGTITIPQHEPLIPVNSES